MFQWKFNNLLAECKNKGVKTNYRSIAADTGISTRTLVGMAKNELKRIDENTMDALIPYFSRRLGRQVVFSDIVDWSPELRQAKSDKPTS